MFETQEEAKKTGKSKYNKVELDLEILKIKQKHNLDPGDNPPPPGKKLRRWLHRKKKQRLDLENVQAQI